MYAYRLRLATNNKIKWIPAYQTVILWDFASAVTPSVVGGAAVSIFLMKREGISLGRGTAVAMLVSMLDQFFYVLITPIIFIILGEAKFPDPNACSGSPILGEDFAGYLKFSKGVFWLGYGFNIFLVLFLSYGLFINTKMTKYIYKKYFGIGFLNRFKTWRKWREQAEKTIDDIELSSKVYKKKPAGFWMKMSLATIIAWSARFLIAFCIIAGFTGQTDVLTIYGRQFVLWIITLIPATPGASGVAEFGFIGMLCEFIPPSFEGWITFSWRFMTYYIWAILGIIILPMWTLRTDKLKQTEDSEDPMDLD